MISIESGWLSRVERTQNIDISHLYHFSLHVIYERMVLGPAVTTIWILYGTNTISSTGTILSGIRNIKFVWRILTDAAIFSASSSKMKLKTPNAHLRFNITEYGCPVHVINNPCHITCCIISRKVSRKISIWWKFREMHFLAILRLLSLALV